MFFSYLVPKTITTINSTISQCQIENEPMICSSVEVTARAALALHDTTVLILNAPYEAAPITTLLRVG